MVRCADCGLYYVNPQPSVEELFQIYRSYDSGEQWRSGEEHFNRSVCRAIVRFRKSGRALDIGSGSGDFLRTMREAGFSVYGVEPSESGSSYARGHHGIEVFQGTVEQFLASRPYGPFDVISMMNVLEHLKDPAWALREFRAMMSEDGVLAVVVPDARLHVLIGEIRKRIGASDPYWMNARRHPLVAFDPPKHLCSFEPRTIQRLIEGCGFQVLDIRNAPVVFNADRWKNVAKVVLRASSEILYRLTIHRQVMGYSTLVLARRAGQATQLDPAQ